MTQFELADIEGGVMDDAVSPQALSLFTDYNREYQEQCTIDAEGEALAPSSLLLMSAGVKLIRIQE